MAVRVMPVVRGLITADALTRVACGRMARWNLLRNCFQKSFWRILQQILANCK